MEFDLIEVIRARSVVARADVALGIGDDAAILEVPAGHRLVACTDTLVAGVHFLPGTAAGDIGWKSLAVNLSDLAAMGADPAWALLALTLPAADPHFVERLADGFVQLAGMHGVALVGGDTTSGPLSITVTALGTVCPGAGLTRGGAGVGDGVYVTGTLGDAAGALSLLRSAGPGTGGRKLPDPALLARMHRPEPRIAAGRRLAGIASACIDVSDGLLADLGHVCKASGVGAEIDAASLPVSPDLRAAFDAGRCRDLALGGGDDYELCFTLADKHAATLIAELASGGLRVTRVGRIVAGEGMRVLDADGHAIDVRHAGWEHFAE